jgi:sporulation protein YlmC with PRC-barrel domain
MKSGERLIAGLAEFTNENGVGVGFIIRNPYILGMMPAGEVSSEGDPTQFQINFTKWFPFSSDNQFKIPYNTVVAIGEPDANILNVYLEKFGADLYDGDDERVDDTSDSGDSSEGSGLSDSGD